MKTIYSILLLTCFFYVSSFAQISLPYRTLDTTLLVGATQGSADVSGSGAATYNIPIFVSPGTAGMQPSISINYNSQAANGVLGVGWNIAGLSAITRVGKDYYHDGEVKGVSLAAGDRFEWDGNRLYSKVGTYGANGTEYATESESFAKIISNNQAGNGPESFTITTKDGTILTYGATADSRIEAPGSSTVLLWRLNQVKDINGNYINYYYNEYSGDSYIDRIEYTGNEITGLLPYNKLKFTYEDRPDKSMYYLCGTSINQTKRLISINMISEFTTPSIRRYDFIYSPIDSYGLVNIKSRLSQIKELANESKSFNTTLITWGGENKTQIVNSISTSTSYYNTKSLFSDLNGDGLTDQFILSKTNYSTYYSSWTYYQSDGNTLTKISSGTIDLDKCYDAFIADINNDGKNDILLKAYHNHQMTRCFQCDTTTGPYSTQPENSLIQNQGLLNQSSADGNIGMSSTTENELNRLIPINDTCCETTNNFYECVFNYSIINNTLVKGSIDYDYHMLGRGTILPGQLNDDGKTDLLVIDGFKNLSIGNQKGFSISAYPNFNSPDLVELFDFDGDGLDEVFVYKNAAYTIYKYNNASLTFVSLTNGTLPQLYDKKLKTGDFNGDGKTDIVIQNVDANMFSVYLSTGSTFGSAINTLKDPVLADTINKESDFYVLDLNGDGRDDILDNYSKLKKCPAGINNDGNYILNGSPGFTKYFSKFNGQLNLYGFQKLDDAFKDIEVLINLADIDGDGMKDATLMVNPSKWTETPSFNGAIYKNYANTQQYRVDIISNGMNQAVGFTYTSLAAANSTRYTKGKSSQFPVIDIQPAQFVVASLTTHAGYKNGSYYVYSVTDFSYKGARSHMQGRGYLGFDTLVSVNNLSGIKTESCYGINTPYYFRYPIATNSYVSGAKTSTKTTTFVTQATGTGRYYSYPATSIGTDLVSNTTVTHKYKFDNFGNMTSDTAFIGSDAVVATTNTYVSVGGSVIPNKPGTSRVSSQYTAQAAFGTYKTFGYDAKGNLVTTVDFADQAKPVTSTYSVNSYGLPVSTSVSGTGMATRTSYTDYDIKYRLPVRSKNALGHKSARTFNYALGVPLSDSAANGLQTTYAYDEFGRLKSTTVPQGYSITQSLNWPRTGNPAGTIFSSTTTTPGKPTVKTYYDILGRALRSEQNGFLNQKLTADFNYVPASPYGKAGLLTSQTYPYYTNETPETVSYKYDAYGRVTETNDRGMATLTTYSEKTVTTTDPSGQVTTKTLDAMGNLVKATDNGGNVVYQYHSSGQPKSISAVGATTTITYDAYGRQITLTDPDAGTTRYTYNAFGELASQTNANNYRDTIYYDILGRVTQKTLGSDVTTYVYNTSGPALGQLASVTGANATKQEYAYDSYGRMNAFTQTIPGQNTKFTTSYVYDIYNNITQITYPETGFVVKNIYENGTLVRVNKADGTLIWQVTDISSHGLPKVTQAGNNLYTTITYDMDQPASIITTGVQSETYTINHPNIGNLASRTDNLTGQSESFLYDNLDRLTKCFTPIKNIAYATNGNISSKTEGGSYTYYADRQHAVKDVTKTAATIKQMQQDISYTKFNKAELVTQYNNTLPIKTQNYTITYGPDQQRVKTIYTDSSGYKTLRYYAGSYEKDSIVVGSTKTVKKIHYITGGTGLVAVFIKWSTGKDSLYYVCKDRQGSIVALVNESGTVSERYSYDAWGRRRNPANWADYNVPAPRLIARGYTGHEHLDGFGLINMNGRMYDPVIGRVLSPDNYVQDPTNTQSYNRYSYCLNNPLRYTDPSGWFAAAADQYWNLGKDITDYISFSGRRASCGDGFGGGGGQGWGGNGGVLPAWYGGGDYGDFWRQLYSSVNHLCNSNIANGVYYLNNVDYSSGKFSFSFNYLTKETIKLNRDIAIFQKEKAFNDKMKLAAASNIGYGKSFDDPGGWDDFVAGAKEIWYSQTVRNLVPDLLTVSFDLSFVTVYGAGGSWQLNILTRGKDPGVFFTNAVSTRYGIGGDWGVNIGWGYFQDNPSNITRSSLLGLSYDIDAGYVFGVNVWGGVSKDQLMWVGAKAGIGLSIGISGGKNNTYLGLTRPTWP